MKCKFFIISLVFFSSLALSAQEKSYKWGEEAGWNGIQFYNIQKDIGKRGFENLQLKDQEYSDGETTDLLLHFNNSNEFFIKGYHTIQNCKIDAINYALGGGAAIFSDRHQSLILRPKGYSLFAPGKKVGDFSIEFRLLPSDLSGRENVFYWKNVRLVNNKLIHQNIRCSIKARYVQWSFVNFFTPEDNSEMTVTLKASSSLIPGKWSHHIVSFDSRGGRLSYVLNDALQDVQYITTSGREFDSVIAPRIGLNREGQLSIGSTFNGRVDELRIEKKVVEMPFTKKFNQKRGVVLIDPVDFIYSNTHITKISSRFMTPQNSNIFFYYRTSNFRKDKILWRDESPVSYSKKGVGVGWIPFVAGKPLDYDVKGRFLQILIEFYTDGNGMLTPTLKDLEVDFLEDLQPIPPTGVEIFPQNGKVLLKWNPVTDIDLAGYKIYFGEKSGYYYGKVVGISSPVDVGNVTQYTIDHLSNGKLYFFSIVAYDKFYKEETAGDFSAKEAHKSAFSVEVSARPSRVYQMEE